MDYLWGFGLNGTNHSSKLLYSKTVCNHIREFYGEGRCKNEHIHRDYQQYKSNQAK